MIWRSWPVPCTPRGLSCTQRGAKDFQELGPVVSYLAGLNVVTPYIGGTSDADVVLKVLKLETDAVYTDFLDRKLVGWYAAAEF